MWSPEFVLPHLGRFECDFMYLVPNRPSESEMLKEDEVLALLGWFQQKYQYFKEEVGEENADKITFDSEGLANTFAAISD